MKTLAIITKQLLLTASLLAGLFTAATPALATPGVFPPGSTNYGKTDAEWSVAWWQWALGTPEAQNPVLDTNGQFAAVGQSGPVWFLGGTFGDSEERTLTIAHGKAIFMPVFQFIFGSSVGDCDPSNPGIPCDVPTLRQNAAAVTMAAQTLEVTIDGVPVNQVRDYRAASPGSFSVTFPQGAVFGLPAGTFAPHVADGYWLMLEPLSLGNHTIRARVVSPGAVLPGNPDPQYAADHTVIYHINVQATSVLEPCCPYYGKTYPAWTVAWWQWALGLPEAQNPVLDTNGQFAAVGQSGPVWFLGGTFGDSEERTLTITDGKAIFMPVFQFIFGAGVGDCDPSNPGVPCDVPKLRQNAAAVTTAAQTLDATIDGEPVVNIRNYRAVSPDSFSVTFPQGAVFGLPAGTFAPHVADGYWLMLEPPAPGNHTIRVRVISPGAVLPGNPDPQYAADYEAIYHLNVTPAPISVAQQGTNIALSWPQTPTRYVLEQTDNLIPANWLPSGASIQATGSIYQVTIPMIQGCQFFRLRKL